MVAKRNDERRKNIFKLRRAGKTYREIAKIENIHHSTVYEYAMKLSICNDCLYYYHKKCNKNIKPIDNSCKEYRTYYL